MNPTSFRPRRRAVVAAAAALPLVGLAGSSVLGWSPRELYLEQPLGLASAVLGVVLLVVGWAVSRRLVRRALRNLLEIYQQEKDWAKAIEIARHLLKDGAHVPHARRLERLALGPSLGQCCGGIVHLRFAPLDAAALARLG